VRTVIDNVELIDGTGEAPVEDGVIIIDEGRIVHAGRRSEVFDAAPATRWQLGGKTVVPGFIEAHTHAHSDADMLAYVKNGVTTVRFAGLDLDTVSTLRARIDAGEVRGPRILSCGPMIDAPPPAYPEWSVAVTTPAKAARMASQLLDRPDVEGLIITQRMTEPLAGAVIDEAHRRGRRTIGQTWAIDGETAATLGIDELHTSSRVFRSRTYPDERLLDYGSIPERLALASRGWATLDWELTGPIMETMIARGVSYCGMQVITDFQAGVGEAELEGDIDYRTLFGPRERESFRNFSQRLHGSWSAEDHDFARRANDMRREWMRQFRQRGGILLAGTDMQFGGIMLHREFQNLADIGMAPLEVIATATGTCARTLGVAQGVIREGHPADLVILNRSPRHDLSALRDIASVIINGEVLWSDGSPKSLPPLQPADLERRQA
jgi:hypothetical protein